MVPGIDERVADWADRKTARDAADADLLEPSKLDITVEPPNVPRRWDACSEYRFRSSQATTPKVVL